MIILDTNIISEIMKQSPSSKVLHWLDNQDTTDLFVTAITIAEISYGLNALPKGSRRQTLEIAFNKAITSSFSNRIITFDETAGYLYGKIMASRKSIGKPLGICDGQIAALASLHNFALATRNIKDFKNCDIELINPFT